MLHMLLLRQLLLLLLLIPWDLHMKGAWALCVLRAPLPTLLL